MLIYHNYNCDDAAFGQASHDDCIVEDTPPAGVQVSFWCRTAGGRIGSCWGYARDRGAGMAAAMSPPDGMWEAADRGMPACRLRFPGSRPRAQWRPPAMKPWRLPGWRAASRCRLRPAFRQGEAAQGRIAALDGKEPVYAVAHRQVETARGHNA